MHNFTYHNPVKIVFGQGTIAELAHLIPTDKKVLITYGVGSIFKNGVMDQVKSALKNHQIVEFGGIEANPDFETCLQAVDLAKSENVDFILSVGGGSVLDATKYIAFHANNDFNDPWAEVFEKPHLNVNNALPFGSVITLPATGSEMNQGSVISWRAKNIKRSFRHSSTFPTFSIIDPETTYSLPVRQTTNGIVDTFAHIVEQYIMSDANSPIQDGFSAMLLKVIIENGSQVLQKPNDYNIRANLFWASTNAWNGFISAGRVPDVDWSSHKIGHELTAIYGLDHGQSLAPIILANWQICKDLKKDQLLHMAQHVFNITEGSDQQKIDQVISKTTEFFKHIGMKTKLSEYDNIPENCSEIIIDKLKQQNFMPLGAGSYKFNQDLVRQIIDLAY